MISRWYLDDIKVWKIEIPPISLCLPFFRDASSSIAAADSHQDKFVGVDNKSVCLCFAFPLTYRCKNPFPMIITLSPRSLKQNFPRFSDTVSLTKMKARCQQEFPKKKGNTFGLGFVHLSSFPSLITARIYSLWSRYPISISQKIAPSFSDPSAS